ncbi:MAG: SgcJ/EcaC family oxidoreductase [Phreatobacter sp.]|jgi:uncharacterized protein (TIGR02246 family)
MPAPAVPHREADRHAILDLVENRSIAWNEGDAEGYAALRSVDADYAAFDGTHLLGRTANARSHDMLFRTVLKSTRPAGEAASVRFLTDDVALGHCVGAVVFSWQCAFPAGRRSIQTLVLQRLGSGWTVAAFHNERIRPMPGPDSLSFRMATDAMHLRDRLLSSDPYPA